MVVEDFFGEIQEMEDGGVGAGVVDVIALFAAAHQVFVFQNGELLGYVRQLEIEPVADLRDGELILPQFIKNANAHWVGKRFEEFGFEIE